VKVTNVEIREIIPPPAVQEAMTRQMSAERTRRAVVTEAEGSKQAAITVAEGNKQAAILNAEGDRQAAILRAEGFALALSKIFSVARGVDARTMSLQYLEALKVIGSSPSTKFVVPLEVSALLSGLGGLRGAFGDGSAGNGSSDDGQFEPAPPSESMAELPPAPPEPPPPPAPAGSGSGRN
jgi:regulator of protease activity HflC (stomatin/prohibitin superfamily)